MPKFCYVPYYEGRIIVIRFGSNELEESAYKGRWTEALELNRQISVGPHQTISMFICSAFNYWPVYEHLSSLSIKELLTIMRFIFVLGRTAGSLGLQHLVSIYTKPENANSDILQ